MWYVDRDFVVDRGFVIILLKFEDNNVFLVFKNIYFFYRKLKMNIILKKK